MLNIENLSFSYTPSAPYILNDISLHINKGDYVTIIGENGSAKSTLIKLILNILKPNKGNISFESSSIGYVPQRMEGFNKQFPLSVKEMLSCHLKALKLKDKSVIKNSLEKVNMLSFSNTLIGNLSGGQQQKIFICRALIGSPDLLILDEPSTGIDIQSQKEIYSLIKTLNLELGITVISVEHNLEATLHNSTHIYELSGGKGHLYTVKEFKKKLYEDELRKVE